MIMTCVRTPDGGLQIGEWDYQYVDVNGVQVARNPLPSGSVTVEIDIITGPDGGLYPADYVFPESDAEKIIRLEADNETLKSQNSEIILTLVMNDLM